MVQGDAEAVHAAPMTSPHSWAIAVLLLLSTVGCRSAAPVAIDWRSPAGRDHPLVGRVWDVRAARFIDEAALVRQIREARFVLLGEMHDNVDHHLLQARVLRALVDAGRRPAVAFEMLRPAQGAALAGHLAARPGDSAGLGDAVGWATSGWPEWKIYEPIARVALDAGLPIVPANLDDDRLRAMRRDGVGALDPALVTRYGLDTPLPDATQTAMTDEIREAHCGHVSGAGAGVMVTMQRARDASLAEALLSAPGSDGAVLIAGSGHVRVDRGVPAHLRRAAPSARGSAIAFVEVDPDRREPTQYHRGDGGLPFDYVWFTPGHRRDDPCETFRRSLERLRR